MGKEEKLIVQEKWFIAILAAVIIIAVYMAFYMAKLGSYRDKVGSIALSGVDIAAVPGGTYEGEYDAEFVYVKVRVTVADGAITGIDCLSNKTAAGSRRKDHRRHCAEQRIDVDAVSGATSSSHVIKKAVDNALAGALS
jgi:uncharacterized protein with FMN-binding domain